MGNNNIFDIISPIRPIGRTFEGDFKSFRSGLRGYITNRLMEIAAKTSNPEFPAICSDITNFINCAENEICLKAIDIHEYLQAVENYIDNNLKQLSGNPCMCRMHSKLDHRHLGSNEAFKVQNFCYSNISCQGNTKKVNNELLTNRNSSDIYNCSTSNEMGSSNGEKEETDIEGTRKRNLEDSDVLAHPSKLFKAT